MRLIIFCASFIAASLAFAASDGEFRMAFEAKLKKAILNDSDALVPTGEKYVQVEVSMAPQPEVSSEITIAAPGVELEDQDSLLLEKVGIWASGATQGPVVDQLDRINRLKIQFVADDDFESKKELLEEIIRGSVPALKSAEIDIQVGFKDLKIEAVVVPPTALDWAKEFKIPLGLLGSGLLLGLFLIIGFTGYRSVERGKLDIMSQQLSQTTGSEESGETEKEATVASGVTVVDSQMSESELKASEAGTDKFREIVSSHPHQAVILFRQWINSDQENYHAVVNLLSSKVSGSEFQPLLEKLSENEKKRWLEIVRNEYSQNELGQAAKLLSHQIIESFLTVQLVDEEEKRDFLASLTVSEMTKLVEQDEKFAAILFNVMNSNQISSLIGHLDEDKIESIVEESLNVGPSAYKDQVEKMQKVVAEARSQKTQIAPMVEKAPNLILHVGPEKETPFFRLIAKAGEFDQLRETALRALPAGLVFKLSEKVHKEVLRKLPVKRRAELLTVLESDQKTTLEKALGDGRGREIIDVEIEEINSDSDRLESVKERKNELLIEFTQAARDQVNSSEEAMKEALPLIESWMSEISEGAYNVAA